MGASPVAEKPSCFLFGRQIYRKCMIAWVVKADRETLDDIATLFCRAGRRIPHRLNALVRHRATNEAANIFDMAIKENC